MPLNLIDLENRIRNVERAAEIAVQLEAFRSDDDLWAELVTYAIDNAHREARELREAFYSGRKTTA